MKIDGIEFIKLRNTLYPIIHNKNRTLDELIYLWDFFKEHEIVIDSIIKAEKLNEVKKIIKVGEKGK